MAASAPSRKLGSARAPVPDSKLKKRQLEVAREGWRGQSPEITSVLRHRELAKYPLLWRGTRPQPLPCRRAAAGHAHLDPARGSCWRAGRGASAAAQDRVRAAYALRAGCSPPGTPGAAPPQEARPEPQGRLAASGTPRRRRRGRRGGRPGVQVGLAGDESPSGVRGWLAASPS